MAIVEPFHLWGKSSSTEPANPPTAKVDTWAAADAGSLGGASTHIPQSTSSLNATQVESAQNQLNALGFNSGSADGIAGPKTEAAVREFQRSNGLLATGKLDAATTTALSAPATVASAAPSNTNTWSATATALSAPATVNSAAPSNTNTWAAIDSGSLGAPPTVSEQDIWGSIDGASLGNPNPVAAPATPGQRATNIETAASPQIEAAATAQAELDSAQGFVDWAVADAASLGVYAPTIEDVEEEVDTVRSDELPALIENANNKTAVANRAVALGTLEELGVDPTEENVAVLTGALDEATSDDERHQILEQTVDSYDKQQTYNEVNPQIDSWVTDMLGDQGILVNRQDLLIDVESMVVDGLSSTEIEVAIRDRLENIRTSGLDAISNGTVVEVFDEAHVVNAGLKIDQNNRDETQREVLDTLQVTFGVASDEAVAEQLGVSVNQLGNTLLVRNAQNADNPQDAVAELQENPQYQANAERQRLAEIATWAIADGSGYGATIEDMGLDGITDLAVQGEIIENSGAVDAILADLSLSISTDGEAVPINLTQEQRNEIALERGLLIRNQGNLDITDEGVIAHIGMRANNLHWQNQSEQDIAAWQAQGVIPEFGYDSAQSGLHLDLQNNAARTAWALEIADQTADGINLWQADRIGVTDGVEDATTRLLEHYEQNPLVPGSQEFNSINYSFGGFSAYIANLEQLKENPSVDEIRAFRDRIDEVLTNDWYHLPDETRAMFEASRAEFDEALAGAQRTRDAANGDLNLADSNTQFDGMQDNFDQVAAESGGVIGKFLDFEGQYLGVHSDAVEEEITALEALASIPEAERSVEQQAAYSVLAQGLLGKNLTSGTVSGVNRFDQGEYLAESFEEFMNDGSKQAIILGSVIVGAAVSFVNPIAGAAIIVGGTGGGLTLDKATGNDHLSWQDIGTETGIAAGSLLAGGGVSRLATKGATFIAPTTRGGQLALGGGVFVAEELTSEVLINTGAAWVRGEDINAQTIFDPVGLLYGLPFAAGDARRIINGSSVGGNPNTQTPDVVDTGSQVRAQGSNVPDNSMGISGVDVNTTGIDVPTRPQTDFPTTNLGDGNGLSADGTLRPGDASTSGNSATGAGETGITTSTDPTSDGVFDDGAIDQSATDADAGFDEPSLELGPGTPQRPDDVTSSEFRNTPGHLTGVSELSSIAPDQLLHGSDQVAGWIPHEIGVGVADRLYSSGRDSADGVQQYKRFGNLRQDIWKEIAVQNDYAMQFPGVDELNLTDGELLNLLKREKTNALTAAGFDPAGSYTRAELEAFQQNYGPSLDPIERMSSGKAPIASDPQRGRGTDLVYEIHHMTPIENGGGVYDLNNLVITSPVKHDYDLHNHSMS